MHFQEHEKNIINKFSKSMGLSRKLHFLLARLPFLTIKVDLTSTMMTSHTFKEKLESILFKTAAAILLGLNKGHLPRNFIMS